MRKDQNGKLLKKPKTDVTATLHFHLISLDIAKSSNDAPSLAGTIHLGLANRRINP
jgi:hypothetical protein